MAELAIIVTGASAAISEQRIEEVSEAITIAGGRVTRAVRGLGSADGPTVRVLEQIPLLALWGLHYSGTPISARSLQARVGFAHQIISRFIARLSSPEVGWLEPAGTDNSQPGRPIAIYRLSNKGLIGVRQVATQVLQAGHMTVRFQTQQAALATALEVNSSKPGLVVPALYTSLPIVPYDTSTPVLICGWTLQMSGISMNAPDIRERLRCDDRTALTGLEKLLDSGYVGRAGASARGKHGGTRAHRFVLTGNGYKLSKQYMAALFG